jgi:UDP-N-acetylmuramoylalanine--D-glutamate ligase
LDRIYHVGLGWVGQLEIEVTVVESVERILNKPEGRKVLVVGLARSGRAAAKLLASMGACVIGSDRAKEIDHPEEMLEAGIELSLGDEQLDLIEQVDLLVLSPGVKLTSPWVARALALGKPFLGELELAYRLSSVPVVAVTGTNGKSTTASLCAHLLERGGLRCFLGGNIGRPYSELLLHKQAFDVAVIEVSSFQLEHISRAGTFVPRVGVWLNLTPDHLDRHGDMETYAAIKQRMFVGQTQRQAGIFFADDPIVNRMFKGLKSRVFRFGRNRDRLGENGAMISSSGIWVGTRKFQINNARLAGEHNFENAAAAILAAVEFSVAADKIQLGLDEYAGLPHRMEEVLNHQGVRWINDSKGTNPDATAKSLTSFHEPIILIAGGRGKDTDYSGLREKVAQRVSHLVLLGEDADRLATDLDGLCPIHHVESMKQAVALAGQIVEQRASSKAVVLLSPACASFDMFKNFEERGEVFSLLVRKHVKGKQCPADHK